MTLQRQHYIKVDSTFTVYQWVAIKAVNIKAVKSCFFIFATT